MNKTVYSISAFSILLIIPPAVMLFAGWHWQPSESTESLKWLYWLTETAGLPYSLITSAVLLVLALAICQPTKANIIKMTTASNKIRKYFTFFPVISSYEKQNIYLIR